MDLGVPVIPEVTPEVTSEVEAGAHRGELVVLLHGLGRTRFSMRPVERALRARGFRTANIGYRSGSGTIEALAARVWAAVEQLAEPFDQVHFVTHSLGGILVRQLLKQGVVKRVGRVVMLAPPNHGSEIVDDLGKWRLLPAVMGPAFEQLGTGPAGPERLGPASVPVAVIAGRRTQAPFSGVFSGPNDGKVSTESARLEGMSAFLIVNENHMLIMRSPEVHEAIVRYLETGELVATEARRESG
ncbi:MAG: alpha/beta fold hydrolase [Pseudomonadota bacterium]|nr:alpha/beta fold hydrolase [Pseudomonadota bacterium]